MDNLILYSRPGCGKCNVIRVKLNQHNVKFTEVEDTDEVNKVVEISGITSAPVLKNGEEYYDFGKAIDFIKGLKE